VNMKRPINTAAEHDPLGFLMDAMTRGASGAIMGQESQGQRSFVGSDTLPSRMGDDDKRELEAAGVKFMDAVEGDPMFTYVELPKGWKKIPTDHSMWSNLVDDKGRERAAMFYKAAFYDRSAHLNATRRYSYGADYGEDARKRGVSVAHVRDRKAVIFSTPETPVSNDNERWAAQYVNDKIALAWLDEHYPEWRDASKYWD